mgnify:CR=1 FL=1
MRETSDSTLTTWQKDRRAFIEHRVYWHGSIGLGDLMSVIGISRAQASKDLNAYIADHPDHLFYDKTERTYVIGPAFSAHYLPVDPAEYLASLAALAEGAPIARSEWIMDQPDILRLSIPARGLNSDIVRAVVLGITQKRRLNITYQSMSSETPAQRSIVPHAIAHDGFRWHARALCERDQVFKDFVISRMLEASLGHVVKAPLDADADWLETITLCLAPHPGLSDSQRRVIELDYGMTNGLAELTVRKCLLYYNLKRLGLDTPATDRAPRDQQIVLANASEVFAALGREAP